MDIVIETDRLLFRKLTEDDAPLLYDLNLDPEVIRYTHDPLTDVEEARKVLEEVILPQYILYDHGRWAVHLRSGLEFIGWCGLKYLTETNEVDLGYRLKKNFWGNGYATEAARACIKYWIRHVESWSDCCQGFAGKPCIHKGLGEMRHGTSS